MKKFLCLMLIFLLTIGTFAGCSFDSTTADQGSGTANSAEDKDGELGDYSIVIDSCRLAKDYAGKNVVIVKYIFENVKSENSAAFYTSVEDAVFQNGVGLNKAYMLDDSANYSSDNQTKEIRKGASLEVEVAYELNDTTTDIEVEVSEWISFNDKKVVKTFSIK